LANDVVILSLPALNPRAQASQAVRTSLLGNADAETEKHLLEVQMNIVRETAGFGPVLLLAPDETSKTAVSERCQEFRLCDLLRNDRVRIKVVAHDGVWVRDFGPQIESAGDSARVAHWRYFDLRLEEAKREKAQELETARLRLLAARQQEDQPDALTAGATPDAHKTAVSTIDAKLFVLREYAQLLNDTSPQRTNDEDSAFDIADAVLSSPQFAYRNSNLALDGGNLFKLDDGRCLTTRVLLSRNKDQNIDVSAELEKTGGCTAVTFLEPLPGPVIEHVDMFALPVGGKRILLASYDLAKPFAAEYWSKLSEPERDLAVDAQLAMEKNADLLNRLGYEVIPVASPFPRIPADGHIYYPSVLNALVRSSADGSREVLLPAYQGYETDIQESALRQITAAFGPKTEIATIEATAAAKAQGAIHCLTLTVPRSLSIFGDPADTARRIAYRERKEQLDQSATASLASQIPSDGLRGSWAILDQDAPADVSQLQLYPRKIFFGDREFEKGIFDQLESYGTYLVHRRDPTSWSLQLQLAAQDLAPAEGRGEPQNMTVQWITRDEIKLTFDPDGDSLLLQRIDAAQESPFKLPGRTAAAAKARPNHGKPAAYAGAATGTSSAAHP
jgi:agmatine/peptidylarginine deiminase